jgi:hypothetical protein
VLDFHLSREKLNTAKLPRSAPGGERSSPDPGEAGVMPRSGMPGAFCNGIVKNQPRSAAERLILSNPAHIVD